MAVSPRAAETDAELTSLLVVDDDPSTRQVLREFLEHAGFRTGEAPDAGTALARIASSQPAALVLHDHLSGEQGLEILRELRAHHPELPVVFIAHFPDPEAKVSASRMAPTAYLPKPFHLTELLATVRRAVPARPGRGLPLPTSRPTAGRGSRRVTARTGDLRADSA